MEMSKNIINLEKREEFEIEILCVKAKLTSMRYAVYKRLHIPLTVVSYALHMLHMPYINKSNVIPEASFE